MSDVDDKIRKNVCEKNNLVSTLENSFFVVTNASDKLHCLFMTNNYGMY
jgi:hypothetical protein